jgi:hypothetical protein
VSPASFEEFLSELTSLSTAAGAGTPALDPEIVREAGAAAQALAGLQTVNRETIAEIVRAHPQWVPFLASCAGLGLEQLKRQLQRLARTSGWTRLAQKEPERLVAVLDEAFGLIDQIRMQREQTWTFADVLVERYVWSRRRASTSVLQGRRLENVVEEVVASIMGDRYVMRTKFIGRGGEEAPCDFAIPDDGTDALIIGAVKGFNSTGSKLSDAVREIDRMASVRLPRQFVFAFVDGIGWLGRQADLKRIYDLWITHAIDGLYSLARTEAFRQDLTDAARRLGLFG